MLIDIALASWIESKSTLSITNLNILVTKFKQARAP